MGKLLGSPALIAIQNLLENKRWQIRGLFLTAVEVLRVAKSICDQFSGFLCRVSMDKELVFTHPMGKH